MAETFDPRVYGCRINLERLRGVLPDGTVKRYGDVAELKAEKIDDDSALKGKWALFAKITPTDDAYRDEQGCAEGLHLNGNSAELCQHRQMLSGGAGRRR